MTVSMMIKHSLRPDTRPSPHAQMFPERRNYSFKMGY